MGRVTATIAVTNEVDKMLAERGFIATDQVRSITIDNVLVDTGATRLCLPEEIIAQLGLTLVGEIDGPTVIGSRKFRLFKNVSLALAGREGRYDCVELPAGQKP
ncbi:MULTISPECIES: aspartyl protease [unclassified Tychonema]|uniref:aspartyl protease n=1 Tax=unclassified Tychonema TaxID=2642144 RepID=UPI0030DADCB2